MLKNLKIRGRLFLGFGTILTLIVAMNAVNLVYGDRTSAAVVEMTRRTAIVEGFQDASLSIEQARSEIWASVATGDKAFSKGRDEAFERFGKQYAAAATQIVSPTGRHKIKDHHK